MCLSHSQPESLVGVFARRFRSNHGQSELAFRLAPQTILKIGETSQAQFLEFLEKKNVVDMIIQVQHRAEDCRSNPGANHRQVVDVPVCSDKVPPPEVPRKRSGGDAETGYNHPEHPKIYVTKDAMRHEAVEMPVVTQRQPQTIQ